MLRLERANRKVTGPDDLSPLDVCGLDDTSESA